MIKSFTSVEQAQSLVEKGLDSRTADMAYIGADMDSLFPNIRPYKDYIRKSDIVPCWSATRLMALLPSEIIVNPHSRLRKNYDFELLKYEPWQYLVCYHFGRYPNDEVLKETDSIDSPLDALVDMLLWVLENGYEDKGIHKEIAEKE